MSLAPGTRLGAYEITAAIGAGGMGEVYRARDVKLKRDVALKVLPEDFSRDDDRVARLQREAELLATLNHPNIAAVYGFEESAAASAIVLELVEGETLADRIAHDPLPLEDAMPIARQIADALEAAHDRGVVHRDLKPANVKITPEGTVKVLDFGLAKVLEAGGAADAGRAGAAGGLTNSPTLSIHATYNGVILGTAAYMSPEQARGKRVDRRADIWAFGCVLFEMLTGKQAFDTGETISDAVAAVLKSDPEWDALPADTPARIRTVIRRCLEKDPQKRLSHIAIARYEMDERSADAAPVARTAALAPPPPLWKQAIPFAATATLVAALVAVGAWAVRPATSPPAVTRFPLMLAEGQQFTNVFAKSLALSPDGTQLVYQANQRFYLRSMSDFEARPIPGTENTQGFIADPEFSPDGKFIAYWSRTTAGAGETSIKRIAVGGGTAVAQTIIPIDSAPYGMSWGTDGIVFGQAGKSIMRVSPDGSQPEVLVTVKGDEVASGPQMLPDGKTLLFTIATGSAADRFDNAQIVAQSLKSGARKTLVAGGSAARYLPTGHIVYALGGVLWAVPFDPRRLEVTGRAVPIVEGVRRTSGRPEAVGAQFSASSNGSLIYIPGPATGTASGQLDLALGDRKGTVEPLKLAPRAYQFPRLSPDGKRVAFGIDDGKEADIWVYDLSGTSLPRRLSFGGRNRFPVWTSDGQRIAFQSNRDGDLAIFWQRADISGAAERLTKADAGTSHVPEAWSRKGDIFLFTITKGSSVSLSTFSLQEKNTAPFGGVQSSDPTGAVFSPDGRWVAYSAGDSVRRHYVYVQPFPATGEIYQVSSDADDGHHPMWSADGKELFFIGPSRFMAVGVTTQPKFAVGNPVRLPRGFTEGNAPSNQRNYDVTPDGQRFIGVIQASGQAQSAALAAPQIDVVLNWFEELKQRVPPK